MKIWISGIVPTVGSEDYGGIRLAASPSKLEAYRDMNQWLDEPAEILEGTPEQAEIDLIEEALAEADDVRSWAVYEQDIEITAT